MQSYMNASDRHQIRIEYNMSTLIKEEDEVYIKHGVQSLAISNTGDKFAVIDHSKLYLAIFDSKNGKLLKSFVTKPSINSEYVKKPFYQQDSVLKNYELISNDDAEKLGLSSKNIINNLYSVKFLDNNKIFVAITFRAYAIDTLAKDLEKKKSIITNIAGYSILDENLHITESSPFIATNQEFSLARAIYPISDSNFIVTVSGKKDSGLVAFSLFNKEGLNLQLLSYMPQDYSRFNLGKIIFHNPLICNVKNKFYWTTEFEYKIRKIDEDKGFEIQGFDSSNLYLWYDYKKAKDNQLNLLLNNQHVKLRQDIRDLGSWQDSLIAVYIFDKENIIQFYNTEGVLEQSFVLVPPKNQTLQRVYFASNLHKIFAITKDEENYYFTDYIIK